MNCASDKFFSVHSTGGPDIFGRCVRALDLLRGRRAARFHFAAAGAGSKKHCSEFNLSGLQYLDSSGTGELAKIYVSFVKVGGQLKVVGLSPKDIPKISQLYQVFPEFPTEEVALWSFPESSPKKDHLSS